MSATALARRSKRSSLSAAIARRRVSRPRYLRIFRRYPSQVPRPGFSRIRCGSPATPEKSPPWWNRYRRPPLDDHEHQVGPPPPPACWTIAYEALGPARARAGDARFCCSRSTARHRARKPQTLRALSERRHRRLKNRESRHPPRRHGDESLAPRPGRSRSQRPASPSSTAPAETACLDLPARAARLDLEPARMGGFPGRPAWQAAGRDQRCGRSGASAAAPSKDPRRGRGPCRWLGAEQRRSVGCCGSSAPLEASVGPAEPNRPVPGQPRPAVAGESLAVSAQSPDPLFPLFLIGCSNTGPVFKTVFGNRVVLACRPRGAWPQLLPNEDRRATAPPAARRCWRERFAGIRSAAWIDGPPRRHRSRFLLSAFSRATAMADYVANHGAGWGRGRMPSLAAAQLSPWLPEMQNAELRHWPCPVSPA